MKALLECGHTVTVPNCCEPGNVTACDRCPPPDDAPGVNRKIVEISYAFSLALAGESSRDLTFDEDTETFIVTAAELDRYAKIIAYKVAHNLSNGFTMDADDDPLIYHDCNGE